MKNLLFNKIDFAQMKAIALNDLDTAIRLNWLKYSLDAISYDDATIAYIHIISEGRYGFEDGWDKLKGNPNLKVA